MNLANKVGEGNRITRDSFGMNRGETFSLALSLSHTHTHNHTHTHAQELHYDFHVLRAAEAIREKLNGSCWNVHIQVNDKKEGRG